MLLKPFIVGFLTLAFASFAQPTIAVLDFDAKDKGRDQKIAVEITTELNEIIEEVSRFSTIPAKDLYDAMDELEFDTKDLQIQRNALKVGAEVKAKWIVVGYVEANRKTIDIEADIYHVESGEKLNKKSIREKARGRTDRKEAYEALAKEITRIVRDDLKNRMEERKEKREELRDDRRDERKDERRDDRRDERKDEYRDDRRDERKDERRDDRRDERKDERRDDRRDERKDERRDNRRDERKDEYRDDRRDERKDERRDDRRDERRDTIQQVSPKAIPAPTGPATFDISVDTEQIFSVRINGKDHVPMPPALRITVQLPAGKHSIQIFRGVMPMVEVYKTNLQLNPGESVQARFESNQFKLLNSASVQTPSTPIQNQTPTPAPAPAAKIKAQITGQAYLDLLEAIKAESFENSKIMILESVALDYRFEVAQMGEIMELFSFENNKLDVAKFLYPLLIDKNRIHTELKRFGYESTKTDFIKWTKTQPKD